MSSHSKTDGRELNVIRYINGVIINQFPDHIKIKNEITTDVLCLLKRRIEKTIPSDEGSA